MQGKITNQLDIEGVHVLNTSSRLNTITDENGHFTIKVKPLDTLLFSSIKYMPEKVAVTEGVFEKGVITVRLTELVNELDEVFLQPNLSGNIAADLKKIKTEKPINFDDVGIPGFKGKPEEKIVPLYFAVTPLSVNLEALYKHISGYYKDLKTRRKWEYENNAVAKMLNYYTVPYFMTTYGIPENRVYDFLLFCAETTAIESDFKKEHYGSVLLILDEKAKIYAARISEENKE
ncbi:hypothetical protein POV26_06955 [Aequorivita todarodis]|uniref:carboxypeptidase-like regulatory domain-containing protein n=1 Tax=Aequorivita todarodis TaxID=2036821 RepID=UPI002350C75B|nr:carboxypeptidase-like regulatory domain-containing protein [Aequorivita todarodis]MDC8000769.1 hypothetical protein [Aequorivita todarodis]